MSKRKIRKVLLSFEMASIEREEFKEEDEEFKSLFEEEFELELAFLEELEALHLAAPEATESEIQVDVEKPLDPEVEELQQMLKPLHRAIVAKLHPDINGPSTVLQFQEFQSAWEEGDFAHVISVAVRFGIADGLDDKTLITLEARAAKMAARVSSGKKTARWFWGSSDRNEKKRDMVVHSLGINTVDFEAWKAVRKKEVRKNNATSNSNLLE